MIYFPFGVSADGSEELMLSSIALVGGDGTEAVLV